MSAPVRALVVRQNPVPAVQPQTTAQTGEASPQYELAGASPMPLPAVTTWADAVHLARVRLAATGTSVAVMQASDGGLRIADVRPASHAAAAPTRSGATEKANHPSRGTIATVAALSTVALGQAKSIGLDKGRVALVGAMKGYRALRPLERARVNGVRWTSIGKDLVRGPSTATVPVQGGMWGIAARMSNGIGSGLAVMNVVTGVTNTIDGYRQEGWDGLYDTKAGRTGVFEIVNSVWTLQFAVRAMTKHRDKGQSALQASVGATWLSSPRVKNIKLVGGVLLANLVLVNELGWFSRFDKHQ